MVYTSYFWQNLGMIIIRFSTLGECPEVGPGGPGGRKSLLGSPAAPGGRSHAKL